MASGKVYKIFNEVFDSLAFDSLPIHSLGFETNPKNCNQKHNDEGQHPNHVAEIPLSGR
jgi:hypothetical protein